MQVADETYYPADRQQSDAGLSVRFEVRAVVDKKKTAEAGHPIHRDADFIRIQAVGDKSNIFEHEITEEEKRRFSRQYAAWKAGCEDPVSGIALKEWGILSRSQIEDLAYHGIKTVEQLAAVSDGNLKNIGAGAMSLRDKAKAYLEHVKGAGSIAKLQDQLDAANNEKEVLKRQMAEMVKRLDAIEAKKSKG